MLFNSYEFIFVFLPLALAGFFLLGRRERSWSLGWLIVASLGFYAWWRPVNVLIVAPSILINFGLARLLQRMRRAQRPGAARVVLLLGVAFNVAFLGYFKYATFATQVANDLVGAHFTVARVVLPLGISFITFQKIAFLIDVHAGRVESFSLQDYFLFVLFFPQLIAGPIVHYREMLPQFHRVSCRPEAENLAVGLTLFAFGLFKKVVLADSVAPFVSTVFGHAASGQATSLLPAWFAALGYTFQIYFDFSGYSDMALGLARLFGVRFPPNFDSPLKASSIIDFWLRWHITLTRFLTAYVYNPMAVARTRRRMRRGQDGLVGGRTTAGAFAQLLALPTLLTMMVSGVWHGAGYLFVLWGLLHGLYLVVNHAWRMYVARRIADRKRYERVMGPVGFVLTFVAVVVAMVLFRAENLAAARSLLVGMTGLGGVALPAVVYDHLGPLVGVLEGLGVGHRIEVDVDLKQMAVWVAGLGAIALLCPNTLHLLSRYDPALGMRPVPATGRFALSRLQWRPTLVWALIVAVVGGLGAAWLGGRSEFLYWQF